MSYRCSSFLADCNYFLRRTSRPDSFASGRHLGAKITPNQLVFPNTSRIAKVVRMHLVNHEVYPNLDQRMSEAFIWAFLDRKRFMNGPVQRFARKHLQKLLLRAAKFLVLISDITVERQQDRKSSIPLWSRITRLWNSHACFSESTPHDADMTRVLKFLLNQTSTTFSGPWKLQKYVETKLIIFPYSEKTRLKETVLHGFQDFVSCNHIFILSLKLDSEL